MGRNRKCCVPSCTSAADRTLFSFPKIYWMDSGGADLFFFCKGFRRCLYWIQKSGNACLLLLHPERMHKNVFMCAYHFTSDQFAGSTRKKLKSNSLPSVFSGGGLSDVQMSHYVNCLRKCFSRSVFCSKGRLPIVFMDVPCLKGTLTNFVGRANVTYAVNGHPPSEGNCHLHSVTKMTFDGTAVNKKSRCRRARRKCSVLNCSSTDLCMQMFSFPRITMYNFGGAPFNCDKYFMCREWVRVSGSEELLKLNPLELWKRAFVCSAHFQNHHFQNKMKKKLLQDAIPTEFLAVPISQLKMNCYHFQVMRQLGICMEELARADSSRNVFCGIACK